ncbi:MAG: hypothetical protein IKV79_02570 [Oscillospiraceae bacterium]|nr:hypothetical protein [Oscillospiraceae bacterium]
MKRITFPDFDNYLRIMGRCYKSEEEALLWFNWTLCGFEMRFRGKSLKACFAAMDEQMTAPFEHEPITLSPVIGWHTDKGDLQRHKLTGKEQWVEIFCGEEGEHSALIRKISENVMGKCALIALETDGEFLPPPPPKALQLEFVGDSITCSYGNESTTDGFKTEEENSEIGYAHLAARELSADLSIIAVTGCSVNEPIFFSRMINRGMLSMYANVDTPLERKKGKDSFRKHDFADNPKDAIIINLGTNDANECSNMGFPEDYPEYFRKSYRELIELIRRENGPQPWIICTLGSMDYYLWDEIISVASAYANESGDKRIVWEKLGKLNTMTEGIGADGHPSKVSHERMGKEMAKIIRKTLGIG